MGSYINIGLVSEQSRNIFLSHCEAFLTAKEHFKVLSGKYPQDMQYKSWNTYSRDDISLKEALEYCYQDSMAEIVCSFTLSECIVEAVLIRIKQMRNLHCLLIEIPECNSIFKNIEKAEDDIISFLRDVNPNIFLYAFCDSDADIYDSHDKDISSSYSILIKYSPCLQVLLNRWRIDGVTNRSKTQVNGIGNG